MEENLIGNARTGKDIFGNSWTHECIGCAIANHDIAIPCGAIYEDKSFILSQNSELP